MTPTKAPPGTGAMISTLCFAAAALALADAALQADGLRTAGLWACSLAAAAGALRHPLARLVARVRGSA